MTPKMLIGISGFARSGKDTMARLVRTSLSAKGVRAKVFSFASSLKEDVDIFCKEKFGISSFVEDTLQKNKIRPILVAYGNCQRSLTRGNYWIDKLKPKIDLFFKNGGDVGIISDLRFKEYDFDEYDFIRSYSPSYIATVSIEGNRPAHESEEKSFSFFLKNSDSNIVWESSDSEEYLLKKANPLIKMILNHYDNNER